MENATLILKVDSRGAKSASDDLNKLEQAAEKAGQKTGVLTGAFKMLGTVLASAALAKTVSAYIQMADASANMNARLRLATKSQDEFNKAQRATFEIAQRTSSELGSVVDLYGKLSQSTGELGLSQDQVLRMTETITQAFQVSGASAQEAAGGLRQLGQAMAGGTLRAEEFNSIIESSPRIVQALADHFGVSFGKVRALVNDGKISSQEFAQAMLSASEKVQAEFDQMPLTVGRATQQVRNALVSLVGDVDSTSGATAGLAEAIADLARLLESQEVRDGFATVVTGATQAATAFATMAGKIVEATTAYNNWLRDKGVGDTGTMDAAQLEKRIRDLSAMQHGNDPLNQVRRMVFGDSISEELQRTIAERNALPWRGVQGGVTSTYDAKPGGSASAEIDKRTKAKKELTEAEKEWIEWEKTSLALDEHIAARQSELWLEKHHREEDDEEARKRAIKASDDLIEQMGFELSLMGLSAVEQEKLIALRYAGAQATDEQRKKIVELVEKMHQARERGEDMRAFRDDAKSLFNTIVTDSSRASDALDRFFDNLKSRMADRLFEGLLAGFGGMSGGGGWAGFAQAFAGAFGGGKAAGGPLMAGQGYIVGDGGAPELFVPNQSGTLHPLGKGGGGSGSVKIEIVNNGAPIQAREQRSKGPDGTEIVRFIIDTVAGDAASGGKTAAAMKGRFGLREQV